MDKNEAAPASGRSKMKITPDALKVTVEFANPFPFPEDEWGSILLGMGFSRPTDGDAVLAVSPDGSQTPAYRWVRQSVESLYQPTLGRVSAEGRDYEPVAEAFETLISATNKLKPPVSVEKSNWTELILNLRAYGVPPPLKAFANTGASKAGDILSRALGEPMMPYQLAFFGSSDPDLMRPLNRIENWSTVQFAPLGPNPAVYSVRYVLRRKSPQDVLVRLRKLRQSFESAFEGLGVSEGESP